jgi:AraC-like DNA-binding protein
VDPLSDILSLIKPRSYGLRGVDAGGDWALHFPASESMRAYAFHTGHCWMELEGSEPIKLSAGDFVLVSGGKAYRLYGGGPAVPINAFDFFPSVPAGHTAVLNGGGGCLGVGGYFHFDGLHAEMLLGLLPSIVHIASDASKAALRLSIERLMTELREPQPGSALIAEHLAQALLVEALRLLLAQGARESAGWLFALSDRQIHAAIAAMHAEPARRWTLHELARVAGMSRSTFALRFKEKVGEPPMEYLIRWRMLLAADRLATKGMTIAVVAPMVGYESESAFGAAFRRVIGYPPRQFAKSLAS